MKENKEMFKGFIIGIVVAIGICALFFTFQNIYGNIFLENLSSSQKTESIVKILNENYVGKYKLSDLQENMYRGLVAGVNDRYTTYMDKDTFKQFTQTTNGHYVGIGTVVAGSEDNKVTVVTSFVGEPADLAGIKSGDEILKVNNVNVFGDKLEEAANLMKGPVGSKVDVEFFRKDTKENFNVTITRKSVDVPTVQHKMMDNKTGYIRITNFDGVTTEQYFNAYNDLKKLGMEKLIIDLRDNPGGLLNVVCKITNSIVPKGVIVYTEDKKGNKQYEYSDDTHIEIPLVVLVNGNSASASEVMTEAIKDYGVGKIIGTTTFGKGVVQSIFKLSDDSAIKITTAKYFSPKGVCIHGIGIKPDILVPFDEKKFGSTFNLDYNNDVQLQKAFETVNEEKNK